MLAIFWPKKDIISFTVFEKLYSRDDGGLGQFRSILQSLIEWSNFDPYYFENLNKLDKNEAIRRISHLKQLQEIRDAKLKEQQKITARKNEEANTSKKTYEELNRQFTMLYQGKDIQGNKISLQQRGYLFESFLSELCLFEKLPVTEPFKLTGEQIDGVVKFEGENYIIEAKWHDWLTASNDLYHFAFKVEKKMYGRGIFISINGYSHDSLEALQKGKAAQTMGRIYVDVFSMKDKLGFKS